jgi:hypothetical protein
VHKIIRKSVQTPVAIGEAAAVVQILAAEVVVVQILAAGTAQTLVVIPEQRQRSVPSTVLPKAHLDVVEVARPITGGV